ncbi:hypothetical protein NIES4101_35370 [Calothrix sp. NIES-4101]|nr:hypothetical protein NIES4101_35370 [Calothrix sp. NIES-4101]
MRHLKTLAWMINGLICSGQLSLSAWEPYVDSDAKQAQSYERRWRRFLENIRVHVELKVSHSIVCVKNEPGVMF